LLLIAIVHSAGIQDRDGGVLLFSTLFGRFPFLKKLFADSAYQGTIFATAIGAMLPSLHIEIVKRSDRAKGFVILPKRWIVERSIAWLNRCRRLRQGLENLNQTALAFLHFASIRLMLRKLCNPSWTFKSDSKAFGGGLRSPRRSRRRVRVRHASIPRRAPSSLIHGRREICRRS
jgi:transposase